MTFEVFERQAATTPIIARVLIVLMGSIVGPTASGSGLPLEKLVAPPGFKIEIYAEDVTNARQMAMGDEGTLFVGSREAGLVHAVADNDGDFVADEVLEIASELTMPSGLAFRDGNLYVATVSEVLVYENIEGSLKSPPAPKVAIDGLPSETHHGWKYIRFGPDGWLYVPVGAPCNVCQTVDGDEFDDRVYASILKYNLKTKERRWVAKGVRNSVGFDWHPLTGELWFSDNGRDMLGNELPPCEINRVGDEGQHFGYPYFHGGLVADPEFGMGKNAEDYVQPELRLRAHVAPLGIHFYEGTMYPDEYENSLFVAEHGSWNRSDKAGYRVMRASERGDGSLEYRPFITGWLDGDQVWGRPVSFLPLQDGSLLVSDDLANVIYRVSFSSDR